MIHSTACIISVLLFKGTVYCMLCVYISNSLCTFVAGFDEHSEGGMSQVTVQLRDAVAVVPYPYIQTSITSSYLLIEGKRCVLFVYSKNSV